MNDQKSPLVYGFLIAGLILLGVSLYFSFRGAPGPDQNNRLARVDRETGTVFLIRSGYTQKEKVTQKASVYDLDSLETNDTGEAMLTFESAYRAKVLDNSMVTLEKSEDAKKTVVTLIIKKGEVRIDSYGREGELYIAKNGERVSATDYMSSPLSSTLVTSTTNGSDAPSPTGLTEEEISSVMNGQSGFFKKCFTQLLQKDQKAQGEASISFTIENSGKLSVVEYTSTSLNQEEFKKCVLDIMSRIEFKPFSGPPISTIFPLKFE